MPVGQNLSCKGSLRYMLTKNCPESKSPKVQLVPSWVLHTGSSRATVCIYRWENIGIFFFKYIWIFSPSPPVVLYLFFLCFHFLKQSLGEILPRLLRDVVALMIIKHCPLEESLPMRERWPNPQQQQQPLLAFLLLFIAFFLRGGGGEGIIK